MQDKPGLMIGKTMTNNSLIEIIKLVIQNQEFVTERLKGILAQHEKDEESAHSVSEEWMDKMVKAALGGKDDNPKG